MTNNEKLFRQKVEKLAKVYVAKNRDYGDSFTRSLDKRGIIASIVRMEDKMNRIDSLYDKPTTEVDESLVDSLEDLANYAIMTAIWLEKQVEDMSNHVRYWDDDDFEDDYDESISHEEMVRELDWNDGWHEFDDDDFDDDESEDDFDEREFDDLFDVDYDDDYDDMDGESWFDDFVDMLSNFDSEDDESEGDVVEREVDWNDGKPKFRIVRRPKGGLSNEDYREMIMDIYEQQGDHVFDTNYLDMIRYLFGTEGD